MIKYRKYFWTMFIPYFVILVILGESIILFLHSSEVDRMKNDYVNQNVMFFESEKSRMDSSLSTAATVGRLMLEYDEAKRFAHFSEDYNTFDFGLLNNLFIKISKYETEAAYLNIDIMLSAIKNNYVVTGNVVITADEFYDQYGKTLAEIGEKFEGDTQEGDYTKVVGQGKNDNEILIAVKRVYDDSSYLFAILRIQNDSLKIISNTNDDRHYLVFFDPSQKDVDFGEGIDEEISTFRMSEYTPVGVINRERNKEDNATIYYGVSATVGNVTFLSLAEDFKSFGVLRVLIICLLWLVLSAVFSYYLVVLLYKPMKNLLAKFGYVNDQDKKEDELEFLLQRAVDFQNVNKQLDDIKKERFISDLLNGFIWGKEAENIISKYKLDCFLGGYSLVVFECNISEPETAGYDEDINPVRKNAFTILKAYMFEEFKGYAAETNERIISFVISYNPNMKNLLFDIINKTSNINLHITAAVSGRLYGLENVSQTYINLRKLIENRVLFNYKEILELEDLNKIQMSGYYYPIDIENRIIESCVNGDSTTTGLLVGNVLNNNISDDDISNNYMLEFKFAMISTIKRILQRVDGVKQNVIDTDFAVKINMCDNGRELKVKILRYFGKLSEFMKNNKQDRRDILFKDILDYIEDNITTDLSLGDVGEHFGFSAGHISKILKENGNISFKTYVNNRKIEIAKKRLKADPTLKIKDLANELGFNNVTSFNRAFKASEGISPTKYV